MGKILIGAGGWQYFQTSLPDALEAYSRVFSMVEVNSTFYRYPSLATVKSWRTRVPANFEFTVRCHRDLTHTLSLRPSERAFAVVERMRRTAEILRARFLLLQTPPSLTVNEQVADCASTLLSSASLGGVAVAWEIRGRIEPDAKVKLAEFMAEHGVTHCVDISRGERPIVESEQLYTRLFGKGQGNLYQFADEEIIEITREASKPHYREARLVGHGAKMYSDAARLKAYVETGKLLPVTRSIGLDSLAEVLTQDAHFPASKEELMQHQGWKVVDIERDRRVHAVELLKKLPEKTYFTVSEVVQALIEESHHRGESLNRTL